MMVMNKPGHIVRAGIAGAKITYQWSEKDTDSIFERENPKLEDALNKTHFKGNMAIGVAVAEWVLWRLDGHVDLKDAWNRIEAAWASVIDPLYTKEVGDLNGEGRGVKEGPINSALDELNETYFMYQKSDPNIAENAVILILIARHVCPEKKIFDSWLSETLRRLSNQFPMDLTYYDESSDTYDNSYEKPVPREFFDPQLDFVESDSIKLLNNYLKGLNPADNPYLSKSEEMISRGFKGKPYSL